MKTIKLIFEDFYLSFKRDFAFLAVISILGLFVSLYGFYQLGVLSPGTVIIGGLQKFAVEFFFLAIFLYFFHLIGIRKKWFYIVVLFLYFVIVSCDITLLMYFKERFGAKYLQTVEGADYGFMTDYRVIGYVLFLIIYSVTAVLKLLKPVSKPQAADRIWKAFILFLLFLFIPFYNLLPAQKTFYSKYLLTPTPIYIIKGLLAKKQNVIPKLTPKTEELAKKYNLFEHSQQKDLPKFDRVIFLSTESLSNKFIRARNPNLPADASPSLDSLIAKYPYASLQAGALSTLYGLSIIFSGHPNAKLSFENKYPISFVRILKENGFKTAFIRGANEFYMDENVLFNQAGFEEVYGANHFSKLPKYKGDIEWWGLTDRKLFDFAVEYLKENKDKKVFIQMLTVDTHVPKGREDYLGQEYPGEPDNHLYRSPNMVRAFWKHDHDLGLFVKKLEKEGLFDDRTLLIVSGDHPFFSNISFTSLVTPFKDDFNNLPFLLISKKPIKAPLTENPLASQIDIAPTVLALTGFDIPKGMFGKSLFEEAPRAAFDIKEDYIIVKTPEETNLYPIKNDERSGITALVNTFLEPTAP
ncbi:Sulfatase family protein [Elusimicrobium minutum Pei191]|uniref:Sulfatase family protein n=1 Tax=Elusimicrobium minutum (strain Pei191) TaxID=445932 RepID=B2KBZ3_ELUMP|nr:LTA synthase family protein [Elusimicrobium minutum]ACC98120.1 Sulfatase family protein [Elusimicrobium minutum Pei191]